MATRNENEELYSGYNSEEIREANLILNLENDINAKSRTKVINAQIDGLIDGLIGLYVDLSLMNHS